MPDWQERITRETRPSVRIEHQLRYAAAAPAIRQGSIWGDLGCGTGVAAAEALSESLDVEAVLVDASQEVVDQARATIGAPRVTPIVADLTDRDDLGRVRETLSRGAGGGVVTCFEVLEHLETFVPLVETLVALAADEGFTAFISVPNDAFWALENPFHKTMWGEGAFAELRSLLPPDHVVARQVPVTGSALARSGSEAIALPAVRIDDDRIPSHYLAAFGRLAGTLHQGACAEASDLDGQRRWERQREANLAFHEAELVDLRAYVHELEALLEQASSRPRRRRLPFGRR